MTTQMTEMAQVEQLSKGLLRVLETYEDVDDVFAPNAFFDINVPTWRFQLESAAAFIGWLKEYCPGGYHITATPAIPTASGFVLEVEGEYADHHGSELFFRNLYVCRVRDGSISEVSFWCTGDWDVETREHHKAEVQLLRP